MQARRSHAARYHARLRCGARRTFGHGPHLTPAKCSHRQALPSECACRASCPAFFRPSLGPTRREFWSSPTVVWECAVIRSRPRLTGLPARDSQGTRVDRILTLGLETFAWEAIDEESVRLGVSVEDLVAFAVLYYLADIDSGRIARQISRSPYPDAS